MIDLLMPLIFSFKECQLDFNKLVSSGETHDHVIHSQTLQRNCSVPVLVLHVCVCCKPQSIMVCSCWQPSLSSMASVIKHVEF